MPTPQQKWNASHPEKCAQYDKAWKLTHPKQVRAIQKKYRVKNSAKRARQAKAWRLANPERVRELGRLAHQRNKHNPIYLLITRTRKRMCKVLKQKAARTIELLGCTPRRFKAHIESLFLPGMSWANRQLWHIDHEKPISSFDLTILEGQQAAFHYTNCQPLWALDNLRKGARV